MRVLKFGGTSLANAGCFMTVADIALQSAAREQIALVLSAPAKVTNLLVALVDAAAAGGEAREEFEAVRKIIDPLVAELAERYPQYDRQRVERNIAATLELVEQRARGAALLRQCPEKVAAFIESRGESFSIAIMAELLSALGRQIRILDPVRLLLAEGGVMESQVNIEVSRERYLRMGIDAQAIVLMSGFVGGDAQGDLHVVAVVAA